jgi:alpha-glucosidase
MPFLYTEFYKASISGVPIMRPLLLEFPDDKTTYRIDTQFMVGENILVSPVMEPGSTSRWMYLPNGDWFDFWTREKFTGGKWIDAKAPIDQLPLFIRAGAVIPMQQIVQFTDQAPVDPITFEIFPSTEAKGICYEDDGISFAYQTGKYRSVGLKVAVYGSEISINRSAPEGEFVPAKRSVVFAVNGVVQKPNSVLVRGKAISEITSLAQSQEGWAFDPTMHRLSVKTSDTQEAIAVVVR